jgi:hypothetical protein
VQHATLDELEWQRVHYDMSAAAVDAAVTDLIELVRMIDRILQVQASADGEYFCSCAGVYLDREVQCCKDVSAQGVSAAICRVRRAHRAVSAGAVEQAYVGSDSARRSRIRATDRVCG